MRKIIIIPTIILLAGVAVVIFALYTKIWNPLWNPFRPKPEVVLSEMSKKMKELKSFHIEGEYSSSYSDGEIQSGEFSFDVDRSIKENPKFKGKLKLPVYLTEIELTKADRENLYIKPGTLAWYLEARLTELMGKERFEKEIGGIKGRWLKINKKTIENLESLLSVYWVGVVYSSHEPSKTIPELSPEEQKQLAEKFIALFAQRKFYQVKEELPDQKINNQMYYHYLAELNQQEIKDLVLDIFDLMVDIPPVKQQLEYFWGAEMTPEDITESKREFSRDVDDFFEKIGEVTFEIWINQKDYTLYKVHFAKEDIGELKLSASFELEFSEFDSIGEIKTPTDFVEMEKVSEIIIEELRREMLKVRDARRKADIRQISLAMEMYYDEHQKYLASKYLPQKIGDYLDPVPQDPGGGPCASYRWISNLSNPQQFCVWACLENGKFFAASKKGTKELNKAPTSLYCW